jgi:hypothetical protein
MERWLGMAQGSLLEKQKPASATNPWCTRSTRTITSSQVHDAAETVKQNRAMHKQTKIWHLDRTTRACCLGRTKLKIARKTNDKNSVTMESEQSKSFLHANSHRTGQCI